MNDTVRDRLGPQDGRESDTWSAAARSRLLRPSIEKKESRRRIMMASFRSPRFFLSLSLSILKRAWRSREREIERREEETKLVRTLARVVASSRVEVRGKKEFCERESRETVTPSRVFMLALSLSRLDNQAKNFSARKKNVPSTCPRFPFLSSTPCCAPHR